MNLTLEYGCSCAVAAGARDLTACQSRTEEALIRSGSGDATLDEATSARFSTWSAGPSPEEVDEGAPLEELEDYDRSTTDPDSAPEDRLACVILARMTQCSPGVGADQWDPSDQIDVRRTVYVSVVYDFTSMLHRMNDMYFRNDSVPTVQASTLPCGVSLSSWLCGN